MPYRVLKPFLGDGVTYREGDTAPDSINHSGAASWLVGEGYVIQIDEEAQQSEPVAPARPAESDTAHPDEQHPPEHANEPNATYGAITTAKINAVNLNNVQSSREDGRITKADVDKYIKEQQTEEETTSSEEEETEEETERTESEQQEEKKE